MSRSSAGCGPPLSALHLRTIQREVQAGTRLTVHRMCELTNVSRAGYYRFLQQEPEPEETELRHQIQQVALQWPAYGSRRIALELQRHGWTVNRKRVQRFMREDNLLCLRRRKFVVTTDSRHGLPVYPNLAGSMTLSGTDQLWLADTTYVRLLCEFVYLAVILDGYSRRVIGWALERSIDHGLSLAALQMALAKRHVHAGLEPRRQFVKKILTCVSNPRVQTSNL